MPVTRARGGRQSFESSSTKHATRAWLTSDGRWCSSSRAACRRRSCHTPTTSTSPRCHSSAGSGTRPDIRRARLFRSTCAPSFQPLLPTPPRAVAGGATRRGALHQPRRRRAADRRLRARGASAKRQAVHPRQGLGTPPWHAPAGGVLLGRARCVAARRTGLDSKRRKGERTAQPRALASPVHQRSALALRQAPATALGYLHVLHIDGATLRSIADDFPASRFAMRKWMLINGIREFMLNTLR